jgi:hypothetical protein
LVSAQTLAAMNGAHKAQSKASFFMVRKFLSDCAKYHFLKVKAIGKNPLSDFVRAKMYLSSV